MMQRIALATMVAVVVSPLNVAGSDRSPSQPRRLILCLDGVAYQDFHAMQSKGAFPYLKPASRIISPFPSLTNPALARILKPEGAPPAQGYEDRYYSNADAAIKGGLLDRFKPEFVDGSFRREFDFHPPGALSVLEYGLPPLSCELFTRLDIWRGIRKFERSKKSQILAYIGPTDCAAHTGGRDSVFRLLRHIDKKLRKLLLREPGLEIVLFSDHGNAYRKYRRVDLDRPLKASGYRVGSRIESGLDVVIPKYGLIGAAAVHCQPGQADAIAGILSKIEGVHFAAFRRGDVVTIVSEGGAARIERREDQLLYVPESADPLDLQDPVSLTPRQWFETTLDHRYPDAVNRVWERAEDVVVNRASIMVDLQPGYYAGSRLLDFFVALKATHGNLDAGQSLGFAASSVERLPPFLGSAEAWNSIR